MPRATDGCGKTDDPRPVDKRAYDRGYLRAFGVECARCDGTGNEPPGFEFCIDCDGFGYIPKDKPKRIKKDEISD